jgi:hypothetical protein
MSEPADTSTRSLLNAVASVRAGQEQLQGDVDKIRASLNGLAVMGLYTLSIAVLIFVVIKWPKAVGKAVDPL